MQEYVPGVISGQAQIFLGIEHGFRGHPDALLNEFQRRSPTWGFDDPALFALLDQAEAEVDESRSSQLYRQAGKLIMDLLPAVPFVHVKAVTALSPKVEPYRLSPTPFDVFTEVRCRNR